MTHDNELTAEEQALLDAWNPDGHQTTRDYRPGNPREGLQNFGSRVVDGHDRTSPPGHAIAYGSDRLDLGPTVRDLVAERHRLDLDRDDDPNRGDPIETDFARDRPRFMGDAQHAALSAFIDSGQVTGHPNPHRRIQPNVDRVTRRD